MTYKHFPSHKTERRLQHERKRRSGTNHAETSLEARRSVDALLRRRRRLGAGGRGNEAAGHGDGLGGLEDSAVAGWDTGAVDNRGVDRAGRSVLNNGGGHNNVALAGRGRRGLAGHGCANGVPAAVLGRRGDGGGVRRALGALGDAELVGVLVLAGDVVDQLDAVAAGAWGSIERGRRGPDKGAAVGDADDNGRAEGHVVLGRALAEDDGQGVGGGRGPGDGEGLARGDDLMLLLVLILSTLFPRAFLVVSRQRGLRNVLTDCTYLSQRAGDGVADWGIADGDVLSSNEAGERSSNGDLGEHIGGWWYYVINA